MKLTRMFATVFIDDSIFVIFTFFRRQIYVYKSRIMCAMCFKWSSDSREAPLHVHRRRMIGNTTHTVAPQCLAPNYCCIYIFLPSTSHFVCPSLPLSNTTHKKCIVIGRENRWKCERLCRSTNTFRWFQQPNNVFGGRHECFIFYASLLPIRCSIKKNPSASINRHQTSNILRSFGDLAGI